MTTNPSDPGADRPLLEMRNITKSFFGVKVLDDVSLDLYGGEVLA
ncbi:MAG TPA: sugar ABC transporter ATP-binding protein, partial [Anaerolineae bacterium]